MPSFNPVNLAPVLATQTANLTTEINQNQSDIAAALAALQAKIELENNQNQAILESITSVNGELDTSAAAINAHTTAEKAEVLAGLSGVKTQFLRCVGKVSGSAGVSTAAPFTVTAPEGKFLKLTYLFGDTGIANVTLRADGKDIFTGGALAGFNAPNANIGGDYGVMSGYWSANTTTAPRLIEPFLCKSFEVVKVAGTTTYDYRYAYEIMEIIE